MLYSLEYTMFALIKKLCKSMFLVSVFAFKPVTAKPFYGKVTYTPTTTPTTTVGTTDVSKFPVVVLHGIESSSQALVPFCEWIETTFNTRVYNLEIGNGERTSLFTPLTEQLAELCITIYNIDDLSSGFNFIGISQGGLLARGYTELCNLYPVVNLITLVAPHGGVFMKTVKYDLLNNGDYDDYMYSKFAQSHLSIASYWRNPQLIRLYLTKCTYLPLLNNEIWRPIISEQQKENIRGLANFVMVWSVNDSVLDPPESGKFSFYNDKFMVIPLEQTYLYIDDRLGLKYLNENGRLHSHATNCSHVDHRNPQCFAQLAVIFNRFL